MRNKLNELKKVERELRGIVSTLFETETSDGNLYLIKFNEYINNNSVIKEIVRDYIDKDINLNDFIYKTDFGYIQFDIPVDESLHYKYILKYISHLIENKIVLVREFSHYKNKKTYNDCIQLALKDLINPLYSYISRELMSKIEDLESKIREEEIKSHGDFIIGDVAKNGGVFNKETGDKISNHHNTSNNANGDLVQGDNNKKVVKQKFYQKEGFWTGVLSGIIVGLAVWGIQELIKFLINL